MGLPFLGRTPSFGFIVHPRGRDDIFRSRCLSLLRTLSAGDSDFVRRVRTLPPTVVGEILFGFSPYHGELVSIPRLPDEVPTARGRAEILRAAQMMVDRGAKVIGLGALTAPATGGGAWLVEQLSGAVTITNGNAYTAAVLRRNVIAAVEALALASRACVAVVGATGSVGGAVTRLLVESDVDLILVGRTTLKVKQELADVAGRARFSESLADIVGADVILVLTSDPSARLTPNLVRRGALVIDAAEPANISEEDARAWSGLFGVTRGGRVRIRDYHCTYDMGFDDSVETFACLAETYLFVREGIREHSVGTPSAGFADRLERAAHKHGVYPSFSLGMGSRERSKYAHAG